MVPYRLPRFVSALSAKVNELPWQNIMDAEDPETISFG